MKVLLVTHFFPPGHAGGTEAYTLGLAQGLLRKGHSPFVICAESWGEGGSWLPRQEDTVFEGIPVRRLRWNWQLAPNPFVNFYDNPETARLFGAYLEQVQPDVVHVTSCYSLGAGVLATAKRAGHSVILTLTDFWFLCPRHTLLRGDGSLCPGPESAAGCSLCMARGSATLERIVSALPGRLAGRVLLGAGRLPKLARLKGLQGYVGDAERRISFLRRSFDQNVDFAIAPSQFLADAFSQNGYPSERIVVSRHGLDLGWLSQLKTRRSRHSIRFGYIGQVTPIKGVDLLVRAFRRLPAEPAAELRVWGDLSKDPQFSRSILAVAVGDSRIRFPGAFERHEIARVLSDLDVVVVPSNWYENSPMVILEAHAAGKPVIATNLGGMSELVRHGVDGLLFERGNEIELTASLSILTGEPGLVDRLGASALPVRTIDGELEDLVRRYEACSLITATAS